MNTKPGNSLNAEVQIFILTTPCIKFVQIFQ